MRLQFVSIQVSIKQQRVCITVYTCIVLLCTRMSSVERCICLSASLIVGCRKSFQSSAKHWVSSRCPLSPCHLVSVAEQLHWNWLPQTHVYVPAMIEILKLYIKICGIYNIYPMSVWSGTGPNRPG